MKTKYIILVALTAIITLSFTFITTSKPKVSTESQVVQAPNAPVGGLAVDDSF
jgi:hypothetical protein